MTPLIQRSIELLEARSDSQRKAIFAKMRIRRVGVKMDSGYPRTSGGTVVHPDVFPKMGLKDLKSGLATPGSDVRKKIAGLVKKAKMNFGKRKEYRDAGYYSSGKLHSGVVRLVNSKRIVMGRRLKKTAFVMRAA